MTPPRRRDTVGPIAGFVALGLFWGGFASLQPALERELGLDDSAMGMARFVGTLGAVVGLTLGGMLVDRLGRRAVAWTTLAFAIAALATGVSPTYSLLLAGMACAGLASGSLDVAMNAEVSALDAAGRDVISLAHALYSVGILLGGAGVGLARDLDAGRPAIGIGVAALMAIAVPLNLRDPLRARRAEAADGAASRDSEVTTAAIGAESFATQPARGTLRDSLPVLVVIGFIACFAFVIEASIGSWSAVHIERTLGATPAVSGWGPGIIGLSMVFGRLAWQRHSSRANALVLVAVGALWCVLGVIVAARAGSPVVAIAGFGIAGLGMSVVGPITYGMAGRAASEQLRGRAIAVVTTIGYLGLLAGPALIGVLADATSLPTALLWLVPFGIAYALLALVASRTWRDSHST